MMPFRQRFLLTVSTIAALSVPLTGIEAQALPTVKEVLDRYVQAIGGANAIETINSIQQRGTLSMPAMGIQGEVSFFSAKPNRMAMTMTIPGLGSIEQGFNGEVGWNMDPMSGPRIATNEELEHRKASTNFYESFGIYKPEDFSSMEVEAKTEFAGEDAYKIKLVRKNGRPVSEYYSVASGLRIGVQSSAPTPMGDTEVSGVFSDYKQIGPIKVPGKLVQAQAGQEIVITFSETVFNTVSDDAFNVPEAVKALLKP